MVVSSIVLGILGVACLFGPEETASVLGRNEPDLLVMQLLGAVYLAMGASNWLARGAMIGGIYARPLSVANFCHFLIGATILIKELAWDEIISVYGLVTIAYGIFALAFILMLFGRLESAGKRD